MTTIEHTPSLWEDNGNGLIYGQCSGDDDEAPFVADVCTDLNRYTDQEQANARLIVSAPAMWAALKAFIDADDMAAECHEWKWENLEHAFELARDIVAGVTASPREVDVPDDTEEA
jgi:hypothetical protein